MAKISRIEPKIPALKERAKVAAYARVSMETDRLAHSLSAQVSYYNGLIQSNPEWEYAGVYADDTAIIGLNQKTLNLRGLPIKSYFFTLFTHSHLPRGEILSKKP